jgi:hypothetical protein
MTAISHTVDPGDSAQLKILAHLDTVALDADLETKLAEYLDRWLALGTDTMRLEGAVGQVSGIIDDPRSERELIRSRVTVIVPFYRAHERLAAQRGASIHFRLSRPRRRRRAESRPAHGPRRDLYG